MADILDALTIEEGSGPWTRGPRVIDRPDRNISTALVDVCSPAYPLPVIEEPEPLGDEARPIAALAYAVVPTRCEPAEYEAAVTTAMARSTPYQAAKLLWHGSDVEDADDPFIAHTDVQTIAAQADPVDTVAALINAAYARHPWIAPVLHVGTAMALRLALALNSSGIPWVTSPAYPLNGLAVTDRESLKILVKPLEVV